SPPKFSASRSRRCRAAVNLVYRAGAGLSDAASTLGCRVYCRRRERHLRRLMGQWLQERFGQPFVIENRPGAGSNIATEVVVNAPADGYTLLLVNFANASNASLYSNLKFNFIRDIAPVAGIVRVPNLMLINLSVPVKTIPAFIAYAKANPG